MYDVWVEVVCFTCICTSNALHEFFAQAHCLQVGGVELAMSLVGHFNEACRFVRALMNAPCCSPSAIEHLRETQIANLKSIIDTTHFTIEEATLLLEAFGGPSPFEQLDIEGLSLHVQKACGSQKAGEAIVQSHIEPKHTARMQSHLAMYNYFTKEQWAVLKDEQSTIGHRFTVVTDRAIEVGLFFRLKKHIRRCYRLSLWPAASFGTATLLTRICRTSRICSKGPAKRKSKSMGSQKW